MRIIIVPLSIDLVWQIFLINLLIRCLFCIVLLGHLMASLYLRSTLLLEWFDSTYILLPWSDYSFFRILRTDIVVLMPFLRSYPIQIRVGLSGLIVLDGSVERNLNPPILVSVIFIKPLLDVFESRILLIVQTQLMSACRILGGYYILKLLFTLVCLILHAKVDTPTIREISLILSSR